MSGHRDQASGLALAVIGGTGLYALAELENVETHPSPTRFGSAAAPVRIGQMHGRRVAFLARHGEAHALAPHKINYRANLWLLHSLGARRVVALNTVGGISARHGPRTLSVLDQLIDYTWGREASFFEESGTAVMHAEFAQPYSEPLRRALLRAGGTIGLGLIDGGCYGATQGPRLETRAEIARLQRDGCDVVGMTGMPEAALARELGMEFACIAVCANWAAGCEPAELRDVPITIEDVVANSRLAMQRLPQLLRAMIEAFP